MTTATATRTAGTASNIGGWGRLAGAGAIGFALVVGGTNAIAGSTPDWDASGSEVAAWVHDHHAASVLACSTFAISGVLLMTFLAGFLARVRRSGTEEAYVPALIGVLGGVLIGAMFSVVVISRLVLLSFDGNRLDPTLTELVWHVEAAAFLVNFVAVGLAVFGVGWAAVRVGLAPGWYRPLSAVALVAGVTGAALSPAAVNGTAGWQLGFVTFVLWLLLLLIVGTRMFQEA